MIISDYFKMAVKNFVTNIWKTFLTMLGVIIGIAAVITIMAVGAGGESLILSQVENIGTNLIVIMPGHGEENEPPASLFGMVITTLKYEDSLALIDNRKIPHAETACAYLTGNAILQVENKSVGQNYNGISNGYLDIHSTEIEIGRFFSDNEFRANARVVVLGHEIHERYFSGENPIGKSIKLNRDNYKIVGVLQKEGANLAMPQDSYVFVPITTAQKVLMGVDHVGFIRVKVDEPENVKETEEDIKEVLRERHDIDDPAKDDFIIQNSADALNMIGTVTDAISYFLAMIAAISLIVGGVGIMNIMLVDVKKRTREIGLRKALGATNSSIMIQFVVESILITVIGGLIGTIFGSLVAYLIALGIQYLGYDWGFIVSLNSLILALSVSGGIGLIFGIYPAFYAARLNPIEALHYE